MLLAFVSVAQAWDRDEPAQLAPRLRPQWESANLYLMIKDIAYWEAWESQGPMRERLTPEQAFALCDAMYDLARSLGAFPSADPLAGLDTKIAMARALNVHSAPGTNRSQP
jgi:hypothetical protein